MVSAGGESAIYLGGESDAVVCAGRRGFGDVEGSRFGGWAGLEVCVGGAVELRGKVAPGVITS